MSRACVETASPLGLCKQLVNKVATSASAGVAQAATSNISAADS